MHILKRRTLMEFWQEHPDTEQPLKTWYGIVKRAKWQKPSDIRQMFGSADFLRNDRVCFNIKGNHYRLVVKVIYDLQRVYIRFVGTHGEYDKIDANTI